MEVVAQHVRRIDGELRRRRDCVVVLCAKGVVLDDAEAMLL